MGVENKIETLHPLEIKVLRSFKDVEKLSMESLMEKTGLEEARIRRAIEWLLTRKYIELSKEEVKYFFQLSETGERYARNGIPELQIFKNALSGITMKDLPKSTGLAQEEISPAIGVLKKKGILSFGHGGILNIDMSKNLDEFHKIQSLVEEYSGKKELDLEKVPGEKRKIIETLSKKRGKAKSIFKLKERLFRHYRITPEGESVLQFILKTGLTGDEESQLKPEHLKDGLWRKLKYRRYSLDIKAPRIVVGKRNPYLEFLDFVKRKLTSMGFQEMVGDHIVTEFWNMDALFMPQFHSARDIHDVYFVKKPDLAKNIEEPYFSNVASMHEHGSDIDSKGWGYSFDRERSKRLILRSQGTVLSAYQLHKSDVPGKYFAMARCFRYDSVDQMHAPDFFQIEGIVVGKGNNFRTLLGLLKLFASEVAMAEEIKFVPGYFPFTEPSVEAHIKHPKIGWMEMGGAGIFRPEVTKAQGVKEPVIAWGLGLDRMAMVAMGVDDIRDLFTTDLGKLRTAKINLDEKGA